MGVDAISPPNQLVSVLAEMNENANPDSTGFGLASRRMLAATLAVSPFVTPRPSEELDRLSTSCRLIWTYISAADSCQRKPEHRKVTSLTRETT
jgi:hypothetical protein